jgi:DnaK suppressor protein
MSASIVLPPDYRPTADEEYMNDMQLEYFRQKLVAWKKSIVSQSVDTLEDLRQGGLNQPDDVDRASLETDKSLDLRTRDRMRKLISKIDEALERIEEGNYGYCEETGEPIGIERLEARPVATLSIEAQERHERMEKTYDDEV